MLPAKIYSFTIPANGMFELPVVGSFFKVLSATSGFIAAADTYGTVGAILAGQGVREADFTRLQFTDTSGANNNLRILIAAASFIDDRITGEVAVIDGERARTLASGYFTGCPAAGLVAAQFGITALVNISTTKNLIVRQAEGGSSGAGGVTYVMTTQAAVAAAALVDQSATRLSNSKAGSALSVSAKVYSGNAAALLAGPLARSKSIPANGSDLWQPRGGLVLPPGYALAIHSAAGTDCNSFVEWYEEPVA